MAGAHSREFPLADAPLHIGWRKCNLQSGGDTLLVHLVHIIYPDRHPDTFVALFISILLKGGGVWPAPSASLCTLAKKDAGIFT